MNYLIYIEHSAENLQFFLWYRSYALRFHGAATADLALASEWTGEMQDEAVAKCQKEQRAGLKRDPEHVAAIFKGTDFEKSGNTSFAANSYRPSTVFSNTGSNSVETGFNSAETGSNPFSTPPRTPLDGSLTPCFSGGSNSTSYKSQAAEAFASAGTKPPCKS